MEPVPTLIVVPARAETAEQLDQLLETLVSVTATAPDAMVLVVDDRSPAPQAALIEAAAAELDCAHVVQQDGSGRSAAFNVGLAAGASHGMDVCLVAPGLVFDVKGWLRRLQARTDTSGRPAAIAGGAVVNPSGMIRHAGFFFSSFRRSWSARLRNVPSALLDVETPALCPVSSDLQLVRREWIDSVGLYDEELDEPEAGLDYCLRVAAAGGECVLEPTVRARALAAADAEPDDKSDDSGRLRLKHAGANFGLWAPEVI